MTSNLEMWAVSKSKAIVPILYDRPVCSISIYHDHRSNIKQCKIKQYHMNRETSHRYSKKALNFVHHGCWRKF